MFYRVNKLGEDS